MFRDTPSPRPSPVVGGDQGYLPPRPEAAVDLRLDGNEGPLPPAELLAEGWRIGAEGMRRYPDAGPLEAAIAAIEEILR